MKITGYLVPPGGEATLRARILAPRAHPEAARATGARGQAQARGRYSRAIMVERYLEVHTRARATA